MFHCISRPQMHPQPFYQWTKGKRSYLQNGQIVRIGGHNDDLVPLVLRFQDGHQLPDADQHVLYGLVGGAVHVWWGTVESGLHVQLVHLQDVWKYHIIAGFKALTL